jgi:hypothetical protein
VNIFVELPHDWLSPIYVTKYIEAGRTSCLPKMNTYIFKGCERVMLEERTKTLRNKENGSDL